MLAAWWWIDRWRKSTAYTDMTAEEQGVYRNLLDELWLRDGAIPDDERILAKIGGDPEAWPRVRAKVLARFEKSARGLTNGTHDEIAAQSKRRRDNQKAYRDRLRDRLKTDNAPDNGSANKPGNKPDSPSPSPSHGTSSLRSDDPLGVQPANPLVAGRRPTLERELLGLVLREAELTNRDGAEVMAAVSTYDGARRSKLNPATMSDDRLMNSVLDARARVKRLEAEHGRKTGTGPRQQP